MQVEEVLDLTLMMGLTPVCDDDHESADNVAFKPPGCTVIAVARLIYTRCTGEQTLVCAPLREWLLSDPPVICFDCGPGCLKVIDF